MPVVAIPLTACAFAAVSGRLSRDSTKTGGCLPHGSDDSGMVDVSPVGADLGGGPREPGVANFGLGIADEAPLCWS